MSRSRRFGLLSLALTLPFLLSLTTHADERAPRPKADTKAGSETKPVLTPEEQAAQTILQRMKGEIEIREQERRFLASQYVQAGKDKMEMSDYKGALRDFAKAAAYEPENREAADGLRRARGILGIQQGVPSAILEDYAKEKSVALAGARLELLNHFVEAKTLFEKGQYREAIEAFTRVQAQAKYLSPLLDVAPLGEEVGSYLLKAKAALDGERIRDQKDRVLKAKAESDKLRQERDRGTKDRSEALQQQAASLLEQHRYGEARTAAESLLQADPGNATAKRLYEAAATSARDEAIDIALRKREVEMQRHLRGIDAMMSPQSTLVYMPPQLLDVVRSRKVPPIFLEKPENAPAWEAKVRETLNKKVSFDFVETPLADVMAFLSTLTDTTIVLDQNAIKDQAPQITLRVADMRLEAALSWICRLAGLSYGLKNEAIFVSTPNAIRDTPRLRMFDITDLTLDIPNFAPNRQALATDSGTGSSFGEEFFRFRSEAKTGEEDSERLTPQALVEFIRRLVSPGKWIEEEGGIHGGVEHDKDAGKGLADVISITVGGRTWVGLKDKE